ncbi:MAG: thioredoxin family protein [Weeksellaceae bacterium]
MIILIAIFRYAMILGSFMLSSHCFSQLHEYSFEEVDQLVKEEPKNIVVFLHTDWCSYCAMMDKTVFDNPDIVNILNQYYYYTPLNAEIDKEIQFGGNTFKFKPTGYKTGVHELAAALGSINGDLSYPTLVVLNEKYEITFQYSGLLDAKTVKEILLN